MFMIRGGERNPKFSTVFLKHLLYQTPGCPQDVLLGSWTEGGLVSFGGFHPGLVRCSPNLSALVWFELWCICMHLVITGVHGEHNSMLHVCCGN